MRVVNPLSCGAVGIAVAIPALAAANGATGALIPSGDESLTLLGLSFIAMAATLAMVSVTQRMHLLLQLLSIYFAIYLLLPGYNHSALNRFPFYNFSYPLDIRASAAWMVTVFLLAVLASYALSGRVATHHAVVENRRHVVRPSVGLAATLMVTTLVSFIVFVATIGFSQAFAVRTAENRLGLEVSEAGLGVALPQNLSFLAVIYATLLLKSNGGRRMGGVLLVLSAPLFLIMNFPLAISRTQLFGDILLFSMLLVNFRLPSRRALLGLGFVVGALVAMPLIDHFTRQGGTLANLDVARMAAEYFSTGDFDGFQSVNNAVVFVDRFGLQHGLQIVSAGLFFIPRAIWTGKAEPTGVITAQSAGYQFTNISQPLPSEFFVDFGWIGVVAGGALLGWLFFRLDRWFDRGWVTDVRTRLAAGLLMGFGLPIYRGTLLGVLPPFAVLAGGLFLIAQFGTRRVTADLRLAATSTT